MLVERMRNALVYIAYTHAFAQIYVRIRMYTHIYIHACVLQGVARIPQAVALLPTF